jgi:hypothetical protein
MVLVIYLALLWAMLHVSPCVLVYAGESDRSVPDSGAEKRVDDSSGKATTAPEKGLGAAKISRNPLTTKVILPFQINWNLGAGTGRDSTIFAPNFQPLIPFRISDRFNLITRTVIPVIWLPEIAPGVGPATGLGDILFTPWFSPVTRGDFVWGIGPGMLLPTATNQLLGTGKWSIGPSAVATWVTNQWVTGVFCQNLWSVAGDSTRPSVNQLSAQTFVSYALGQEWYLTSFPLFLADWNAEPKNRWTVPLGGGFGHIVRVGKQPFDLSVQGYYNVVHPQLGPAWQARFTLAVIFVK